MCCGFNNRVTINFNGGCGGFLPYMPIGGAPMWGCGWGMPRNMASVFGAAVGFGLSGLAMRGIASLFGR